MKTPVKVWRVTEMAQVSLDDHRRVERKTLVLASSAAQAVGLVGETDRRSIVLVECVGELSHFAYGEFRVTKRATKLSAG